MVKYSSISSGHNDKYKAYFKLLNFIEPVTLAVAKTEQE